MHEDKQVRLMLVDVLKEIPGRASTGALARRAAFDLDAEVRDAAIEALRARPPFESRRVFIELLRFPWPPVAQHAAEALVDLGDRASVGQLVASLDEPDPALPNVDGQGTASIRELVRVHHLTNCVLCHPPAVTALDPVLGVDPLLTLASANAGLSQASQGLQVTAGAHSYGPGGTRNSAALVRADVTYLRQEFSARQKMPPELTALRSQSGPLSAPLQRFDFVVRRRAISRVEANQLRTSAADQQSYPQREAALFALRRLSGLDRGKLSADWLQQYPDAKKEAQAARLAVSLVNARGERRDQMLDRYRDEKGVAYTLALAEAIPSVEGKFRERTRDALVERLSRMTAETLQERFNEEDPELRRAAALACGRKRETNLAADLIRLLEDKDQEVVLVAEHTLREITGQSFSKSEDWRNWLHTAPAGHIVK
jgi:hypothetical protein